MHSRDGKRYRATIHYDGSAFAGWQVQPEVRTVQGEIEGALRRLGIEGRVQGAGRTDAGVHAAGQEISFDAPSSWTADEIARALHSLLPADLWIEVLREAEPEFHPRFQATGRRYEYYIASGRSGRAPYRRHMTSCIEPEPDLDALRSVARSLPGRRDFGAFAKSGQPDVSTVCAVEEASWHRTELGDLRFTIVADRFLHRMVRYLVATMVQQSAGVRAADDIERLLSGADDVRPPMPADACGLYLTGVRYEHGWNRPPGVPGLWPLPVGAGSGDSGGPRTSDARMEAEAF
ncbi:MAG: tRNA pseudouridine(38-40) synthase TruA [Candidatus Palauibacterales bacterium]|nr:tRNA pseudouridine(38-40) synthase TruA [Candidatus Palauibacterales bacterium]